jgi:hypothetical protein
MTNNIVLVSFLTVFSLSAVRINNQLWGDPHNPQKSLFLPVEQTSLVLPDSHQSHEIDDPSIPKKDTYDYSKEDIQAIAKQLKKDQKLIEKYFFNSEDKEYDNGKDNSNTDEDNNNPYADEDFIWGIDDPSYFDTKKNIDNNRTEMIDKEDISIKTSGKNKYAHNMLHHMRTRKKYPRYYLKFTKKASQFLAE